MPRDSVVHRLDPRTKILLWLALATELFFIRTYVGYAVFLGFLLAVIRLSRIPTGYVLRGLKPAFPFIAALFAVQLLFSGNLYAWSPNVVFQWRFVRITKDALRTYSLLMLRVLMLFLSVTLLSLVTSLVALTDGVESLLSLGRPIGVPANELAMVMVIALRFVPTLVEELERIVKAQMARGARVEEGNFIRRTAQRIPVLLPLLVNTFRRADDLILAMEARCYRGGKGRTKRKHLKFSALDYKAIAVTAGFTVAMYALMRFIPPPW